MTRGYLALNGIPSYWLKLLRAKQHLEEIEGLVAPYEVVRPYDVRHSVEGKQKQHVYRAFPSGEPDPWIAVVVGEFLFELRSALDHLRAALVPRNRRYSGQFPILTDDPWQRDPDTGEYLERFKDQRDFWVTSTTGMREEAISELTTMQPYWFPKDDVEHLTLSILSRLNNADKHRELVAVANLMRPVSMTIDRLGGSTQYVGFGVAARVGLGPGAVITTQEREVSVEARGTIEVAVGTGQHRYALPTTLHTMLDFIAGGVVPTLEQYVTS